MIVAVSESCCLPAKVGHPTGAKVTRVGLNTALLKTMRLPVTDKTNVIVVLAIAVGACLALWFLIR
jgi:hypothetical protein